MRSLLFGVVACLLGAASCANHGGRGGHDGGDRAKAGHNLAAQVAETNAERTRIVPPDLATHHLPEKPWTSLEAKDAESRFHFAVVTDRTGGHRQGVFPIGVSAVNRVQPAFVMSVGDLIEGYTTDKTRLDTEWDEFEGKVAKFDAPFFYVVGNHDIQNAESEAEWIERFGQTYYHFVYKDTLFIVLNSEFFETPDAKPPAKPEDDKSQIYPWKTSEKQAPQREAQIAYLQRVLKDNKDVRWTFLFMHKPYWRQNWVSPPRDPKTNELILDNYPVEGPWPTRKQNIPDWAKIEPLLADRNYTFFAGHNHSYKYEDASDAQHTHEHIAMATTGGGSPLRGLTYGEFDHFMWVTMTENGPVFANLLLDGVQPKNLPIPDARPSWIK